ncbi:hypothetical protein [Streptomyces collinus]|uniref:hypothetical protein n=1 Tax=Streptomyces collinus TaxID=42684 RepID=UPI002943515A|nr:hypothetical protein [Streptomyces collinus]
MVLGPGSGKAHAVAFRRAAGSASRPPAPAAGRPARVPEPALLDPAALGEIATQLRPLLEQVA